MTFHLSSLISGSVRIDDDLPHNRASAVHAGAAQLMTGERW